LNDFSRAREQNEPLVIFGDYDVDGVTSTALLTEVLRALGWKVEFYLPNRLDEGYGLSADGVENCLKKFPTTLLLAVDCGSTAVETINSLNLRGVDVIVLDHHQVSNPAPAAVALVNPQLAKQRRTSRLRITGETPVLLSPNFAPPGWRSSSPTPFSSAVAKPTCPARRNLI
jgi:single-stranded DNA-specific DHH superfamily exonuclease